MYQLVKRMLHGDSFAHLYQAYKDLAKTYTKHAIINKNPESSLGASLDFNPTTEKFINNEGANDMLTREYRAPYVVPDKV